jgi:hypothetical protein
MNICMLFGGLFPTVDNNTFPLPLQLIASKIAAKCYLFNAINHVCVEMRVGVKLVPVAVQLEDACSRGWQIQAAMIGINNCCIL